VTSQVDRPVETHALSRRLSCRPDAAQSAEQAAFPTLALVSRLCAELAQSDVMYCHWKSNDVLHRSASGENDLDLLVARKDSTRFVHVLQGLGFQEARPPAVRELPGVVHFYGLDQGSGKFVHVHAQYQLILGDDTTKNYRLPIEDAYLESSVQGPVFRVPSPELELSVLVIRMMIKHATWDAVIFGKAGLSAGERREVAYLMAQSDRDEVLRVVRENLAFLRHDVWERSAECVSGRRSLLSRLNVGRCLLRDLATHSRRRPVLDTLLRVWRRGVWGSRRYVFHRPTRKKLVAGGAIIALVGGDGAGKSSAVEGLYTCLSRVFETKHVHLGKPPRSITTHALKGAMIVGRRFGLFSTTRLPAYASGDDIPGRAWLVWHVLTARDRHREYLRARRFASNGGLVISDRYPLPQIRCMDGSRTVGRHHPPGARLLDRRLVDLEQRYYARILEPDVLLVLRVDPEVAVARRRDEDPTFVRTRNEEIWSGDWSCTSAAVLDAGKPQDVVLAEALRLAWSRL
jgi:thymidylate kinase